MSKHGSEAATAVAEEVVEKQLVGGFAAKKAERTAPANVSGFDGPIFIQNAIARSLYVMELSVPGITIGGQYVMSDVPLVAMFSETEKDEAITSVSVNLFNSVTFLTNIRVLPSTYGGKPRYSIGGNRVEDESQFTQRITELRKESTTAGGVHFDEREMYCGQVNLRCVVDAFWIKYQACDYAMLDHDSIGIKLETADDRTARFAAWQKRQEAAAARAAAPESSAPAPEGDDASAAPAPAESVSAGVGVG